MRASALFILFLMIATTALARNVQVKGVPDSVTDEELFKWVAVLVERTARKEEQSSSAAIAAEAKTKQARDTFKTANGVALSER